MTKFLTGRDLVTDVRRDHWEGTLFVRRTEVTTIQNGILNETD